MNPAQDVTLYSDHYLIKAVSFITVLLAGAVQDASIRQSQHLIYLKQIISTCRQQTDLPTRY